jgi:hypothetical protein
MVTELLNMLFGCTHSRTTFPLTPSRKLRPGLGPHRHGTYVVCLDCGEEFTYDWAEMQQGGRIHTPTYPDARAVAASEVRFGLFSRGSRLQWAGRREADQVPCAIRRKIVPKNDGCDLSTRILLGYKPRLDTNA